MDWTLFATILIALGGVLAVVGQKLGWPVLVWLANIIKGIADKDGDGKPDVPGTPDPTTPPMPAPITFPVQPVALAGFSLASIWAILLPALSAILQPLIEQAIQALRDQLGRQPTAAEEQAAIQEVAEKVRKGQIRVSLLEDGKADN